MIARFLGELRRVLLRSARPLLDSYVCRARRGLAKGLRRKGGLGFIPSFRRGSPEERFLMGLELCGGTVFDVGGFEGVFTMFFARAVGPAGRVVTFEPNPINFRKIVENVELNGFGNVDVRQIALGRARGTMHLVFREGEAGRGSTQESVARGIGRSAGTRRIPVNRDTLDNFILENNLPKPDLVKIDTEGSEVDILAGMPRTLKACRPRLFIEIHDHLLQAERKGLRHSELILKMLNDVGYTAYDIEKRSIVTPGTRCLGNDHLYCEPKGRQ